MHLLEDILIDLVMMGGDRGALVRDTAHPCVIVLMVSDEAVAKLGMALLPVTEELGKEPVSQGGVIHDGRPPRTRVPGESGSGVRYQTLTLRTSINHMFADADSSPRHWLMFELHFGDLRVVGLSFSGEICHRVAKICTENGAPCSLDPKKPAEGYEITKTKNRK